MTATHDPIAPGRYSRLSRRRAELDRQMAELRAETEAAVREAPPELSNYRLAKLLGISQVHVARLRNT